MRVIKNMIQAKKNLDETYGMLGESVRTTKSLTDTLNHSTLKRRALMKEHDALLDAFAAEREQKERYRTAFLSLMNVPVIGKAWTGDDGYSEEG